MSLLDMPGCSIEIVEPVSKSRLLDMPCISTDIVGAPCSIEMETLCLLTVFSGALRWRELSSITPLTRFPDSWFSSYTPYSFSARADQGVANVWNAL
jgi:hypothetical protein